jgi:hypothetical protein
MRLLVIVNLIAAIIGGAAAALIAWHNRTSSSLGLAAASAIVASILFWIQMLFVLQPRETRRPLFGAQYTVIPKEREVQSDVNQRIEKVPDWLEDRRGAEQRLSAWLRENNPEAFDGDRERLTMDFAVASALSFFFDNEPDWRQEPIRVKGPSQMLG